MDLGRDNIRAGGCHGSHNWSAVLGGRGEPSRIWFNGVSAGFFDTLGVAPLFGRRFALKTTCRTLPRWRY